MASSILKWVVNHHSCPRSKTRSWKEEARPDEEDGRTGAGMEPGTNWVGPSIVALGS